MHLVLQPCGTHLQLGEHAPKRPALPDPPHPQVALQIREPQLGQAGLPLGRPQRSLPRDRSARPDGCPAAWQPMLVEPVTHRGGVHAKLAGDAGGWPSPDHPPVGQVVLQWWEAQLRRPGGELLVGGGAPGVGGGHPAGRRGDARLVEEVADDLGGGGGGGGGKLTGQPRGTGLLLDPRVEVAGKVAVPLRVSATAQAALVAVEDREAALEGQRARRLRWWWRYTCAWRAGGYDHR